MIWGDFYCEKSPVGWPAAVGLGLSVNRSSRQSKVSVVVYHHPVVDSWLITCQWLGCFPVPAIFGGSVLISQTENHYTASTTRSWVRPPVSFPVCEKCRVWWHWFLRDWNLIRVKWITVQAADLIKDKGTGFLLLFLCGTWTNQWWNGIIFGWGTGLIY